MPIMARRDLRDEQPDTEEQRQALQAIVDLLTVPRRKRVVGRRRRPNAGTLNRLLYGSGDVLGRLPGPRAFAELVAGLPLPIQSRLFGHYARAAFGVQPVDGAPARGQAERPAAPPGHHAQAAWQQLACTGLGLDSQRLVRSPTTDSAGAAAFLSRGGVALVRGRRKLLVDSLLDALHQGCCIFTTSDAPRLRSEAGADRAQGGWGPQSTVSHSAGTETSDWGETVYAELVNRPDLTIAAGVALHAARDELGQERFFFSAPHLHVDWVQHTAPYAGTATLEVQRPNGVVWARDIATGKGVVLPAGDIPHRVTSASPGVFVLSVLVRARSVLGAELQARAKELWDADDDVWAAEGGWRRMPFRWPRKRSRRRPR